MMLCMITDYDCCFTHAVAVHVYVLRVLRWGLQRSCAYCDVPVLWTGCFGPTCPSVPVVEKVSHLIPNGMWHQGASQCFLYKLLSINNCLIVGVMLSW